MRKKSRPAILQAREKTHGDFKENARVYQDLVELIHRELDKSADNNDYGEVQMTALDMIAIKLARVLTAGAGIKDNWDDIAGYAQLASEACDD